MFILDPKSSNSESCDEFDQFLEENNYKDNFNKESKEAYANLCAIANDYFGTYTDENYPYT